MFDFHIVVLDVVVVVGLLEREIVIENMEMR